VQLSSYTDTLNNLSLQAGIHHPITCTVMVFNDLRLKKRLAFGFSERR